MLEFHDDAIVLSGEFGTKLKSEILGSYYPLWWSITSGGKQRNFRNPTAIVELNAGTGEDYIPDRNETILGSSGHALQLKSDHAVTSHFTLILIEDDPNCFYHLQKVVRRNWPSIAYLTEIMYERNGNVYLLNYNLETSLQKIDTMELGNAIFFFDPLLYTAWIEIEKVARKRIKGYYKTGTEFIVFLFTSDWFTGRGQLVALPTNNDPSKWNHNQSEAVTRCDNLYGSEEWRQYLLNEESISEKIELMVERYRIKLHKWFRYVLPLPFEPKPGQIYHLFFCSNYEVGIRITRSFYASQTGNPKYSPDNKKAYSKFKELHKDKVLPGSKKSDEWKILWKIIREHEEGYCDIYCADLIDEQKDINLRQKIFEWLESNKYISRSNLVTDAWNHDVKLYQLEWDNIQESLEVNRPPKLEPLSSTKPPSV